MKQSTYTSSVVLLQLVVTLCSAQNSSITQELPTEIIGEWPRTRCSSYEGRCGKVKNIDDDESCSCDTGCVAYGDCCVDFEQTCPMQYAQSSSLRSLFKYTKTECRHLTLKIGFDFIAICGLNGTVCNKTSRNNLLEPNLAIPITDPKTELHYINYECARCNNVTDAIFWTPEVWCYPENLPPENVTSNNITQELLEIYLPLCSVTYSKPKHITGRLCYKNDRVFIVNTVPFSLSVLFDFDPSEGVTVGRKACTSGQRWIPSIQECRRVSCPPNRRLVDGSCLSLSLQFELKASLSSNKTLDVDNIEMHMELGEFDIDNINKKLAPFLVEGTMDIGHNRTRVSKYVLNVTLDFHLMFNRNSTFNFKSDLNNFIDNASILFNNEVILLLYRSDVNLGNVRVSVDDSVVFKQELLSDCSWHRFYEDEFELHNDTLLLKTSQMMYAPNRFSLLHSDALVCVANTDQDVNRLDLDISPVLGILTIVLISLSIICLTIRLLLQFRVQYFWSFAGKLQFNLFLSLWLAFVMLLLGGVVSIYGPRDLCVVSAILTYWFFLAAFCWMTAVTMDTWMAFRPSATFVKATDKNQSIAKYVLPCWLISAAFTIMVTALDFITSDSPFKPQFGQRLCWFNRRHALLVYFGVPVAVLTLLTTVFFIMTAVHVRRSLKSTVRTTSKKASHHIRIYFRLFSLMGVSWIFGFVAAFVGHDALWIIFIILNASQGILVFVSFVLNRHVFRVRSGDSSAVSPTVTTPSTEMSGDVVGQSST